MKLFLDTANINGIEEAASLGMLDGVTTNLSLVSKEFRIFREALVEICNIVNGPVSAEVVSLKSDAMVKEGKGLAKIHQNIVVKVPLIPERRKATKRMAAEGITVSAFKTFVLVASVRHPQHLVEAALAGGQSCTMPFVVFQPLIKHPLTDLGVNRILADWNAQMPKSPTVSGGIPL